MIKRYCDICGEEIPVTQGLYKYSYSCGDNMKDIHLHMGKCLKEYENLHIITNAENTRCLVPDVSEKKEMEDFDEIVMFDEYDWEILPIEYLDSYNMPLYNIQRILIGYYKIGEQWVRDNFGDDKNVKKIVHMYKQKKLQHMYDMSKFGVCTEIDIDTNVYFWRCLCDVVIDNEDEQTAYKIIDWRPNIVENLIRIFSGVV